MHPRLGTPRSDATDHGARRMSDGGARPVVNCASFYGCPTLRGAYRRRMPNDERDRLLCAGCGDVIGEYEPVWIEDEDGAWHPSSLLKLDGAARVSTRGAWHASCAVNDASPGPPSG